MPPKPELSKGPDLGLSLWVAVAMAGVIGFAASVLRLVYLNLDAGILGAVASGVVASYASLQIQALWPKEGFGPASGRRRGGRPETVKLAPSFEIYDPGEAEPQAPGGGR